ncbi:MAG: type I methionyl aminopeptidase [Candidatus Firestonebacteria bacterium]
MITLKSAQEIELIRKSSRIASEVLEYLKKVIKPDVITNDLDKLSESLIIERGGKSAFKGYRGYPSNICISINEEVVHGIPSDRRLKEKDIVKIDIGVVKDGFYGDIAATFCVGDVHCEAKKLIEVTEKSLYLGISKVNVNNRLGDVSSAIQNFVESFNFSVVRNFTGHGIGRSLHEDPQVPNFGKSGSGIRLKNGMVFCIEPMVNIGSYEVEIKEDKWTVVTKDRSLSAHFEHTIAIVDDKAEILTKD